MGGRHISPAMLGAVGREIRWRRSYPVAEGDIRRWALAVYYPLAPPQRFIAAGPQMTAPEEFNPFGWLSAEERGPQTPPDLQDPDKTEIMLGVEGPHLRFQLNGGVETDYGVRMRPGDVITSVRSLAGYHERSGRHGAMLFTVTEDLWTNQRGERVKRVRHTLIRYGDPHE